MSPEEKSAALAQDAPDQDVPFANLQGWMTGLIGHQKAIHQHPKLAEAAKLHFSGNSRLTPGEQINIYRVQFWLRHTGVLIDHFDGLSHWLGQERWQSIVESYLLQPEHSVFALADLGHKMAEHIEGLEAFEDQQLCVDMARLEWAYQLAFSAADDPVLSGEKLASIPPDAWSRARFCVSDSLSLLKLNYPVADLRRQLRDDSKQVIRGELPKKRPINLVVYRRERRIYDKELSLPAYLLLEQLASGRPLIPACEAVMTLCPEAEQVFETQLMQWFTLWGRLGWITDVDES